MRNRSTLEDLRPGVRVEGVHADGPVTVVAVQRHGTQAVTLAYRTERGSLHERILYRCDEGAFAVEPPSRGCWGFDGDAHLFRLAAEARRIRLAHLFDPYPALHASRVRPLPHQIEAVYGHMLPRMPLRFLLADDPGSGKTIMAGLYIKELMIRGALERCLVVAPGNLVVQWQEELNRKFDLSFEIVTKHDLDAIDTVDVFQTAPLLIARIDQLARRRGQLEPHLREADWDLVVVDEAHRMSAHFFGDEIRKTLRYRLGETLGSAARHLLLMTATPHNGKEEDFQLFMALLDGDRFAGRFRGGVHKADPSPLMRRMVKERLLTFEGRPLFPERRSTTVRYRLSPQEMRLYEEVTEYVREQMNAADRLRDSGDGRRGNTVGFALTILQRRLASSPEAIYQSLHRRRRRLEQRVTDERQAARVGFTPQQEKLSRLLQADPAAATQRTGPADPAAAERDADPTNRATSPGAIDFDAYDELDEAEQRDFDAEVVDAATAAATIAELENEISVLKLLEQMAFDLRLSGTDAKWQQLSDTLSQASEMRTPDGGRRKLIVFTEHRDTLDYLVDRLRVFLGDHAAVVHISGGTRRDERLAVQQLFTQDPDVLVLVATDAAGEGINLQQAHLMVNYDLPWNPNRIEQRFGRVHRIGQTEVCHMWNLVAADTRESQVHARLLEKIEQICETFAGQVYDVLGEVLSGRELRRLLMDAIRYGDRPEVRERLDAVIDTDVPERVAAAIEAPVLAADTIGYTDIDRIRRDMDEAALRRIQPHYVHAFFDAAFTELGGKLSEREPGRYEISSVPLAVRNRHRETDDRASDDRTTVRGVPLLTRYTRVVFDKDLAEQRGYPDAEIIAPGHPLLEALVDLTSERHRHHVTAGTVLADDADPDTIPRIMVMLEHEVVDARPTRSAPHTVVSRRFEFVEISENGDTAITAHARYLDYRPLTPRERELTEPLSTDGWMKRDLRQEAMTHAIDVNVPQHLARVRARTLHRVQATKAAVHERLTREINHWDNRAAQLQLEADAGRAPRVNADTARRRADEYARRLKARIADLDSEMTLAALPPRVTGAALVLPAGLLRELEGGPQDVPARDESEPPDVLARSEVEHRAVQAVLRAERVAGWHAQDMNRSQPDHPGYDIRSSRRTTGAVSEFRYIEVKGRISRADTVTVTRNEILTSLNEPERWLLALVEVKPEGGEEIRYAARPFEAGGSDYLFDVTSVNFDLESSLGERPDTRPIPRTDRLTPYPTECVSRCDPVAHGNRLRTSDDETDITPIANATARSSGAAVGVSDGEVAAGAGVAARSRQPGLA